MPECRWWSNSCIISTNCSAQLAYRCFSLAFALITAVWNVYGCFRGRGASLIKEKEGFGGEETRRNETIRLSRSNRVQWSLKLTFSAGAVQILADFWIREWITSARNFIKYADTNEVDKRVVVRSCDSCQTVMRLLLLI